MNVPAQQLSQLFQQDEVDKISSLLAKYVAEYGSISRRKIYEQIDSLVDYKSFSGIFNACIESGRIEGYKVDKKGNVTFNVDESIKFTYDQLKLIQTTAVDMLNKQRSMQRHELWEACKDMLPDNITFGVFMRELREHLESGNIIGVKSRRGNGLSLDLPDEVLNVMMDQRSGKKSDALKPADNARREMIAVTVDSSLYRVPMQESRLESFITTVFEGKSSGVEKSNIRFLDKAFSCPHADKVEKYFAAFYGAAS